MNIFLYGFKNAGKTFLGKRVAKQIGRPFIDTDERIEEAYFHLEKEKLTAPEIAKKRGLYFFRSLEKTVISRLKGDENAIIALGGGAVIDNDNQRMLKKVGTLLYLKVSREILFERFLKNPFCFAEGLNLSSFFEKIYQERKEVYANLSSYEVKLNGSAEENEAALVSSLKGLL